MTSTVFCFLRASAGLLLLVEAELAVIEDLADGRRGVGGDLDEVEAGILGDAQGVEERHDAAVLPVLVDQLDFADAADVPVGARPVLLRAPAGLSWVDEWLYLSCLQVLNGRQTPAFCGSAGADLAQQPHVTNGPTFRAKMPRSQLTDARSSGPSSSAA